MHDEPTSPPSFVHGIHAEDWAACWNMHLRGTLVSLDLANEVEFGKQGVRGLPIDDLRRGAFSDLALSPRMQCLWQAAIIRSGGWVGQGVPPYRTLKASPAEHERVVRQADFELRLEEARRNLAPESPSRIGCLYLAEATPAGRTLVSQLKGHHTFVMEVEIAYGPRLARVDSRWLEEPGDEEIAGYWSGEPRYDEPVWEYLLDGVIKSTNEEELARLQEWGIEAGVRASGTQGPIGTPGTPRTQRPLAPPKGRRREGEGAKTALF